jgi:uncharacterized protein YjbJ (UPF0337 family)
MAEAVSTGSGSTGSTKEQAQEKAQEVAGQAQEKMGQAAGQAKSTVREQVDQRSTRMGEQVTSQASDVRTVAEELRNQGKEGPAKVAEQAADRAERVGNYLTQSDGNAILHDVENFGRSKPWAVALGGMALGFAASRLLKASSSERYHSSLGGQQRGYDRSYSGSYGGTYGGRPPATSPDPATTRLPAGTGVGGPGNGTGAL